MTDTFMAVVKTFLVTVIFALIFENKSESVPWTNQQEWLEHTRKEVRFLIPELPMYLLDRQNLGSIAVEAVYSSRAGLL